MWERRDFLRAAGATFVSALLPRAAEAIEGAELVFATATQEAPGRYGARLLTETGRLVASVDLPARGHDVTWSAAAQRAVVFARRPGTFAVVFDPSGTSSPLTLTSPPDRHFFGHGVFSSDGTLLYAAENDFANGVGVIGVYDVSGDCRRIGEFPSYGVGPHEILLMRDGRTLAVANGGIETHPDYGRTELNLDDMDPSLAFIDLAAGDLVGQLRLPPSQHRLSIRHLAVDAGGRVWFGCQFRGSAEERPQLVGHASLDGHIRLIDLPPEPLGALANYVGGLAVSPDGETIAVSSPVAGTVLTIDAGTATPRSRLHLPHTCGVAPDRLGFLATNGAGQWQGLDGSTAPAQLFDFQFDEHLRRVG